VLVFAISRSQYEESRAASHAARWDILSNIKSSLFLSIGGNNLSDARTEASTGFSSLRYADSTDPESGGAPIATTDRYSLPYVNDEHHGKSTICALSPLRRLRVVQ
jgi:hypothetical protein